MNMNEWIHDNLHTDQIKCVTNSQVHTTNNARGATNELMNQGVNTAGIQFYNTHQESIILDIVTENNSYDSYSHTSCVDWKIK